MQATSLHNVSSAASIRLAKRQVDGVWLDSGDIERFWAKVSRQEGEDCWLWIGALFDKGYGQFGVQLPGRVRKQKTFSAHRVAWSLFYNRQVPSHLYLLHQCDVRRCVNPEHLFLGCQASNMRDASQKGRLAHGEPVANSLTSAQVAEILARIERGDIQIDIAKDFGVSKGLVWTLAKCLRQGLRPRKVEAD